jgi:hypothetical protein
VGRVGGIVAWAVGPRRSAQTTIRDGIKDLRSDEEWQAGQQRRAETGHPALVERDETLAVSDLEGLLEAATAGDPESLSKLGLQPKCGGKVH